MPTPPPGSTWSYDPAGLVGQTRLLIPDRDVTAMTYTDQEIAAFLALATQSPYLAAALALETAAVQGLTIVHKRVGQVELTYSAAELLARAKTLREQDDLAAAQTGAGFDWAEAVLDPSTARQRVWEQAERGV